MRPEVIKERLCLTDSSIYYITGIWKKDASARITFGGDTLKYDFSTLEYTDARQRFLLTENELEYIVFRVHLPDPLPAAGRLKIEYISGNESGIWFDCPASGLRKKQGPIQYNIEKIAVGENRIRISGWAAAAEEVSVHVRDRSGQPLACTVKRYNRPDVSSAYEECDVPGKSGFEVEIPDASVKYAELVFGISGLSVSEKIALGKSSLLLKQMKENAGKTLRFVRSNGIAALPAKLSQRAKNKRLGVDYDIWIHHHLPSADALKNQRGFLFDYSPLISIVVPLYKTPEVFLRKMIATVRAQSYQHWELVLSDGSGAPSPIAGILAEEAASDDRIRVIPADGPLRIAENTNRAIQNSRGEYIAFLDHDDELTPDALFECVKALNADRSITFLYSDEDKINEIGSSYFQPNMKPDFNIDLLRNVNYICHLTVLARALLLEAGLLDGAFEGAQDYDLVLRCAELSKNIVHIPRVLYHWRSHEASTAENPESKRYAFEAGKRALEAHYARIGLPAEVKEGEYPGLYRTRYLRTWDPLISILIPNKDHIDDLKRCIDSIEEKSTYRNYEYIIIENNSTEDETFAYYKELEETNPKVRVVCYKGIFNFSDINNFGEQHANGDYLLLLNNDTELINGDAFEDMLEYCMRKEVGGVGARLYYEDDTIQHAGVVIGFGGIAGHCFVMTPPGGTGYQHRIICAADYSAVTAACMMVDRKVFHEVGGLETSLAVAFNDVDLCLKIRQAGYLIVYDPYAQLHHYESKSRGLEDTPEKISRFNSEIETMKKRWPDIFRDGDPYYNPNLSLDTQDFSLQRNY